MFAHPVVLLQVGLQLVGVLTEMVLIPPYATWKYTAFAKLSDTAPKFVTAHSECHFMESLDASFRTLNGTDHYSIKFVWLWENLIEKIYQQRCRGLQTGTPVHPSCDRRLVNSSRGLTCINLTSTGHTDDENLPFTTQSGEASISVQYHLWESHHFLLFFCGEGFLRELSAVFSWTGASKLCASLGGHLPILLSREDVRNLAALLWTATDFDPSDTTLPIGLKVGVSVPLC